MFPLKADLRQGLSSGNLRSKGDRAMRWLGRREREAFGWSWGPLLVYSVGPRSGPSEQLCRTHLPLHQLWGTRVNVGAPVRFPHWLRIVLRGKMSSWHFYLVLPEAKQIHVARVSPQGKNPGAIGMHSNQPSKPQGDREGSRMGWGWCVLWDSPSAPPHL